MPVVKILMIQKDEGNLLAAWLSHYSYLFGFENLYIIDNGSRDGLTLSLLETAEKAGVTIYRHLNRLEDYQYKAGHFSNLIRSFDAAFPYDFCIPVDCDEFLAVLTDEHISLDREKILSELDGLKNILPALRIDLSLFNVPDAPGWFAPNPYFHKGFLRSNSIGELDHGMHVPESRLASGFHSTRFVYLHWHNRPYREMQRLCREKLRDLVDVENREALLGYLNTPNAHGAHLVETLLMSENEYAARYAGAVHCYAGYGSGQTWLKRDDHTYIWSAADYLEANEDVAHHLLGPLHHYLRFGAYEGRSLREDSSVKTPELT